MQVYCMNCNGQVNVRMCDAPNDCEDSTKPEHGHCGSCGVTVDPDTTDETEEDS